MLITTANTSRTLEVVMPSFHSANVFNKMKDLDFDDGLDDRGSSKKHTVMMMVVFLPPSLR